MFEKIKKISVVLFSMIVFASCGKHMPEEPPDISIAAGDKIINTVQKKLYWNGAVYCSASPCASAEIWFDSEGGSEYFPEGTVFLVQFPEKISMPETVEISDVLIVSDGGMKNAEAAAVNEIIPDVEEENFTFCLGKHEKPDSYDTSRSLYRCIEITCGWGEDECEYTFCVSEKPE